MDWLTGGRTGEAKRLIAQLGDEAQRDRAIHALIGLGTDALPALLETLQTSDLNLLPIYQQILSRIPSASPSLLKLIASAHPIVRARIAEIFALSKDPAAIPALLDALRGEFYTVRAKAALALGKIGDRQAIPPLLNALKDKEVDVRIAASLALGLFKEPSTFDDICNLLLDDLIIEVRQASARALGHTQHPQAIPYLMEALRDSYWWYEREQAAGDLLNAIEKMGVNAVEPLLEALADREGAVRRFAAILLGRIGDLRALDALGMAQYDLHHEVGKASAEALARFGESGIGLLNEACAHPEAGIRSHAVTALGSIRSGRVVSILIEMLNDPDREVKKRAIESLRSRKEAVLALQAIANDRTDRELAALAKRMLETE